MKAACCLQWTRTGIDHALYRQLENNSFENPFFFLCFFDVFWCFLVFFGVFLVFLMLFLDSSRFSPSDELIFVENYWFWTIFGPFLFFKRIVFETNCFRAVCNVQRSPSENLFYLNRVWKQPLRNSIQNKKLSKKLLKMDVIL